LLLAPIRLNIDSSKNNYLINWGRLGSLTLIPDAEDWFFNLKIGFWKKKFLVFDLINKINTKQKKKEQPKREKKKSGFFKSFRKVRQVSKSFEVKICKIDLDTDDYYWNALLIPVFQPFNKNSQHRIAINFRGKNKILFVIENRLIKILYSILVKK
jgi:hypothetical protein